MAATETKILLVAVLCTVLFDRAMCACECDFVYGACDALCCCDADCSTEDLAAFDVCTPISVGESYCMSKDVLVFHNTPYPVFESEDFLCIVPGPSVRQLPTFPGINSFDRMDQLLSDHVKHFNIESSDIVSLEDTLQKINRENLNAYKVGLPIVITSEKMGSSTIDVIRHAQPVLDGRCSTSDTMAVKFFTNIDTKCFYDFGLLTENVCSNQLLSYESILVANANVVALFQGAISRNDSSVVYEPFFDVDLSQGDVVTLRDNVSTVMMEVRKVTCGEERTPCELVPPQWDDTFKKCNNVVDKLAYIFTADSGGVITSAYVDFHLNDLKQPVLWRQHQAEFHWDRSVDAEPVRSRSGNPGYLRGRPLLAVSQEETEPRPLWVGRGSGSCLSLGKRALLFLENTDSTCWIQANTCSDLQNQTLDWLLGDTRRLRISRWGNPADTAVNSSWVPVLIKETSHESSDMSGQRCEVQSTVRYTVLHAKLGPRWDPQEVVIGVAADFTHVSESVQQCHDSICSYTVDLNTEVRFLDVSHSAADFTMHNPVKIRWTPTDLFYPFLLNDSKSSRNYGSVSILIVSSIAVWIRYQSQ